MATNWSVNRTLLLVGEGAHDAAYLSYARHLRAPRGCGLAVTVKRAHGKGSVNVLKFTLRQMAHAEYDMVGVMLDTDAGCNAALLALARKHNITMASAPRPEAGPAWRLDGLFSKRAGDDPAPDGNARSYNRTHLWRVVRDRVLVMGALLALFAPR